MSNLHGYSDYNGPSSVVGGLVAGHDSDDDDDDMNPLQAGFWMEGDSLAPPCGTSISAIHKMLDIANVNAEDVLYDFGCGDGRVCIEAWHLYRCKAIGIELEQDLVDRANALISQTTAAISHAKHSNNAPQIYRMDLRQVLDRLSSQCVTDEFSRDSSLAADEEVASIVWPNPTVILLYLLPEALSEIEPQLSKLIQCLHSNLRIICNTWGLPAWKATKDELITDGKSTTKVFMYTRPSVMASKTQSECDTALKN
jgi:SAM-dependent methyltransferase